MKEWEVIAAKLCPNHGRKGREMFVVDAHRDGKRFIVQADEKLTV